MLFLPGPAWLLLSKIARRLIYSLCRVVQLNLTPEIEVFHMLFDRCLSIFTEDIVYYDYLGTIHKV